MPLTRVVSVPAALAAATVARIAVAVALLLYPSAFALRDYDAVAPPDLSRIEGVLYRPRFHQIAEDELAYDDLGRSIARGDGWVVERGWVISDPGQPTAYGGALYPLFIGIIYALTANAFPAVVLVQVALSVAAVAGIARIGRAVGGPTTELLAAWAAALHPGLVMVPSLLMTEALSIPCLIAVILAGGALARRPSRGTAVLCGALLGTAFLIRSPMGVISAVVFAAAFVIRHIRDRGTLRTLLGRATLLLLTATITLAPWITRNWVQFDHLVVSDTKSGVNVWMFNRPEEASRWPETEHLNEAERDALFRTLALANLAHHPGWFVKRTLVRAVRFWWPVPQRVGAPLLWLGVAVYVAATLLALPGVVLLLRRLGGFGMEWLVAAAIGAGWTLSALTAVGLRHRLTVEPLFMVTAAMAVASLLQRLAQWRGRQSGSRGVG